jgi:hypothetical protein
MIGSWEGAGPRAGTECWGRGDGEAREEVVASCLFRLEFGETLGGDLRGVCVMLLFCSAYLSVVVMVVVVVVVGFEDEEKALLEHSEAGS